MCACASLWVASCCPIYPKGFKAFYFGTVGGADFLLSSLCQRIINANEPSVSAHLVPEWLAGWSDRPQDSVLFTNERDRGIVEKLVARWAEDLPAAQHDAVGELPLCEVQVPLGTCRARPAPTGSSTRQLRGRSRTRRQAALGRVVPLRVQADVKSASWFAS